MNTKKLLSGAIIALAGFSFLATGQSYAVSGNSDSFILDFGGIRDGAGTGDNGDDSLSSDLPAIGTSASSDSYRTTSALYTYICGNGILEHGEACDGSNLGGQTCANYGYDSGSLSCNSSCAIVSGACYNSTPDDPGGGSSGGNNTGGGYSDRSEPDPETPPPTEPDDPVIEPPVLPVVPTEPEVDTLPPSPESPVLPGLPAQVQPPLNIEIDPDIVIAPGIVRTDIIASSDPLRIGNTTDRTPVISDVLRRFTEYKIAVIDDRGRLVETGVIDTDKDGRFVYEIRSSLDYGDSYRVYVIQPGQKAQNQLVASYTIGILQKQYPDIKITIFGDQQDVATIIGRIVNLGRIEVDKENLSIEGYATPLAKIVAYFRSDISDIIVVTAKADDQGYFQIKIPESIVSGQHSVDIIQEFPDGVRSENLTYQFDLGRSTAAIEFARAYEGDALQKAVSVQQIFSTNLIVFLLLLGALILLVGAYIKEKYF